MFALPLAHADQYRSEVRELPGAPPAAQPADPKQLLENTTDPYERALLLRELAARAAGSREYEAALGYLDQALRLDALSPQAATEMRNDTAQLLAATGKPAEVIKLFEPRLRNNAAAPAGQQAALGAAYLQLERYADALPLLERAVAAQPNPDEAWLQALHIAYAGAGRKPEATAVLERLVRRNRERREYWLLLASSLIESGDRERALAVLELAARLGHLRSAEERLQLVGLTAQQGAPFEAGSLLHVWMKGGEVPRNAPNLEAQAGLWLAARESSLALGALAEAQQLAEDPGRSMQLGQLYMDRDELDRAAAAFDGARRSPQLAATAGEWLEYLDSPAARARAARQAQAGAPPAETVALGGRLPGAAATATPSLSAGAAPGPGRVGARLTDVGAERDGNADGTIPAWTGGITRPAPGYKPNGRLVDPFPQDTPLFTIAPANAAQYAAQLSAGHRALLSKYPDFRMPVYATRRSAAYPQAIYDATAANLGKAKLIGSDALTGARLGFPFPRPDNGVEAMWNHRTRYRGDSYVGVTSQAVVGRDGISHRNKGVSRVLFRYGHLARPADLAAENVIAYGVSFVGERVTDTSADFVVLFHESANSLKKSRAIWVLLGQVGRMLRLPPLGYDQPLYGSDGLYSIDMIDMYNGAFDRYVWKLLGKRELYIPYNAYRLSDGSRKYEQQLTWPTFDGKHARYELHRVWAIEATERGGARHQFGKRVFYLDEDSWNVVLVENQDRNGALWRFQEGHLLTSYDVLSTNTYPIVTYDLRQDRYFVHRLLAEDPPVKYNVAMREGDFLPATVSARYSK
ncbi:MAG: DUF1329 domain-containing protein [Gammaproteobacteria bacterium]